MRIPEPWTDIAIPDKIRNQEPLEALQAVVQRFSTFHRDAEYDSVLKKIPSGGHATSDLAQLGKRLGITLPAEYELLLSHWRYLSLFDGFAIWDPVGCPDQPYVSKGFPGNDHHFLGIGDCWRRADGDDLLIDLDDPSHPVAVWCHEHRTLERLAPSLSLGLYRIVEYLLPYEHYSEVVESFRASAQRRSQPWWKRIF